MEKSAFPSFMNQVRIGYIILWGHILSNGIFSFLKPFVGNDKYGYEKASERWLPIHTVETILISVISMLADPNDESPANVDAAKEWRENYPVFK